MFKINLPLVIRSIFPCSLNYKTFRVVSFRVLTYKICRDTAKLTRIRQEIYEGPFQWYSINTGQILLFTNIVLRHVFHSPTQFSGLRHRYTGRTLTSSATDTYQFEHGPFV